MKFYGRKERRAWLDCSELQLGSGYVEYHMLAKYSGPSCSKLTTALVNDSLKFTSISHANMPQVFAEKM